MKNNRGFTLIELIIVMLIMMILAIGSIAGYNLINVGSAFRAAERINSVLSSVQMDNMTRIKNYTMEIKQDSEGDFILSVYYENDSGSKEYELSEDLNLKNGRVIFENNAGETITVAAEVLEVSFRKDTGGVKAYNTNGDIITRIGITSAGSTSYIRLVTATGKHFIE
jgi:prepilin-type N-terminal cleavage/methylation domain-containing protein